MASAPAQVLKSPDYHQGRAEEAEAQGKWLEAIRHWNDVCARSRHQRRWPNDLRRAKAAEEQAAAWWNTHVPVGTEVRYWPLTRDEAPRLSRTRSVAWMVSDHASVLVEDYSGGICLAHVEPVAAVAQPAAGEEVARG